MASRRIFLFTANILLKPKREMPGKYFGLGNHRFLPNVFLLSSHRSSFFKLNKAL
jgi:hypothetical protein